MQMQWFACYHRFEEFTSRVTTSDFLSRLASVSLMPCLSSFASSVKLGIADKAKKGTTFSMADKKETRISYLCRIWGQLFLGSSDGRKCAGELVGKLIQRLLEIFHGKKCISYCAKLWNEQTARWLISLRIMEQSNICKCEQIKGQPTKLQKIIRSLFRLLKRLLEEMNDVRWCVRRLNASILSNLF